MANGVLPSVVEHTRNTISSVFGYIEAQGDADYIGEAVSQIQHSLQCAVLAQRGGGDDETVLGALLHDIGRFIPEADSEPALYGTDGTFVGHAAHEVLGEQYLRRLGFSDKICQLVGAHVVAKRYLTAVDQSYYDGLSKSSKQTLQHQGGPFTEAQVKKADKDPLLQAKLAVRRCDDLAKDPNMKTPGLLSYEQMAYQSLLASRQSVTVAGRTYALPSCPTVVVCVDGFDPEYLEFGMRDGIIPNIERFCARGYVSQAHSCMPTFSIPNNMSVITGAPPRYHGITTNGTVQEDVKDENEAGGVATVCSSTILSEMARVGVRVAAIAATESVRRLISVGLKTSTCYSAEQALEATRGPWKDDVWAGKYETYKRNPACFVLDAGIQMQLEGRTDLLYLSLSDAIRQKPAPRSRQSDEQLQTLDHALSELERLGAQIAVTGDHGLSDKSLLANAQPNVVYLGDALDKYLGVQTAQVHCPIRGGIDKDQVGLGSWVSVLLSTESLIDKAVHFCQSLPEVEVAMRSEDAAGKFELPDSITSHVIVIAKKHAVLGAHQKDHDMSLLHGRRLRSSGGFGEQCVPLLMSRPSQRKATRDRRWRNYDVFDLVLNY